MWPAVSHRQLVANRPSNRQLRHLPPACRACSLLTLLVVARFTFNALLRRPTQRLAERRGTDAHHRDGSRLLEEVWVTAGNLVMLGMSMHVLLRK